MEDNNFLAKIQIGQVSVSFEVSEHLKSLIYEQAGKKEVIHLGINDTDEIVSVLRRVVSAEKRPPSEKQLSYAKAIAKQLEFELDEDVLEHVNKCGLFLKDFSAAYKDYKDDNPDFIKNNIVIVSQVFHLNRWLRIKRLRDRGRSIELIAKQQMLKTETIIRYDYLLGVWTEKATHEGIYDLVLELVHSHWNGKKITSFYYHDLT